MVVAEEMVATAEEDKHFTLNIHNERSPPDRWGSFILCHSTLFVWHSVGIYNCITTIIHTKKDIMKAKNILIGMIAAAAVGVLVGTLFAPDKGSETRKKIRNTADDLADKVKKGLRRNKATGEMEVTG